MFTAALLTIAKIWKQLKCPSRDEWIEKIRYDIYIYIYIYIYIWILLSPKREWNFAICDNMDGPRGYYAKWNMAGRERQTLCDFTYMQNLKNKWKNDQA